MKNLSSKSLLLIILASVILGSCIAPVGGLAAFFEDDDVTRYIDDNVKATVKLSNDSDRLTGGNRIISGLDSEKYYVVLKETDPEGNILKQDEYPKYVTDFPNYGPGGLIGDMGLVMRIKDGKITGPGLVNLNIYTVKSAVPLPSTDTLELEYKDNNVERKIQISGGNLNITKPSGDCVFDFSTIFTAGKKIEFIAVPYPTDTRTSSDDYSTKKFSEDETTAEQKSGTIVDYVFTDEDNRWNFWVLRISVGNIVNEVKLGDGSDDLETGDGLIKLLGDKYYMVADEEDTGGGAVVGPYPKYAKNNPVELGNFADITRIAAGGGTINGLTNHNTYTVRSAKPLDATTLTYKDNNNLAGTSINVTNGVVTISSMSGQGSLDLSGVFSGDRDYVAIPISGSGARSNATFSTWGSFSIQTEGTFDYVFVNDDLTDFQFLRVIGPNKGSIRINVKLSDDSDLKPSITTGTISVGIRGADGQLTLDGSTLFTITISNAAEFETSSFVWKINGVTYNNSSNNTAFPNTFILRNSPEFGRYMIPDTKIEITVEAQKNGKRWGAEVEITVN
jgi:hypothetical protein